VITIARQISTWSTALINRIRNQIVTSQKKKNNNMENLKAWWLARYNHGMEGERGIPFEKSRKMILGVLNGGKDPQSHGSIRVGKSCEHPKRRVHASVEKRARRPWDCLLKASLVSRHATCF